MFTENQPTIDRLQLFVIKGYLCTWLSDTRESIVEGSVDDLMEGVRATVTQHLLHEPNSTLHDHQVKYIDARVQLIYHDDGTICSFILGFDPR